MALTVIPCWSLILSTCLVFTVNADCEQDCALCLLRLQGKPTEVTTLTCTLECEGRLRTTKSADLCKDVLQEEKKQNVKEGQPAVAYQEDDELQLEKKDGGFMKRYGGFMKKAGKLMAAPDDENGRREGLAKQYDDLMKKDASEGLGVLEELLNSDAPDRDDQVAQVAKRYGGFMRSIKQNSEVDGGTRELQKRYGGFMRRMGRPAWKEEEKRLVSFLQATRGKENEADVPVEKRYGGFMD